MAGLARSTNEVRTAAAVREEIFMGDSSRVGKRRSPSRRDAEPPMNEVGHVWRRGTIFLRGLGWPPLSHVLAALGWGTLDQQGRRGMTIKTKLLCAAALSTFAAMTAPAQALTMQECSSKYQAAKTAGTLNGMKWNDFRKSQCGAEATPAAAPA